MKAILVIDLPKVCDKCPLIDGNRCMVTREEIEDPWGEIEKNCPLKPIPKYYPSTSYPQRIEFLKQLGMTKKEQHYYELGHDDCIDELLGEKE